MSILENKIEKQVQFWTLLGPLLILLAIVVLLFKVSEHLYLPLSVLVGVPLCVKWKLKGLGAALTFLITLSILNFPSLEIGELYWHTGMAMAIALSFIILTLSLEEMQSLIKKVQVESQARLDNFMRLDGNVKTMEHDWIQEKERLTSQVNELSKAVAAAKDERDSFQKVVLLSKEEMVGLRKQHERLLEDLYYKKQQIAQLQERLEENDLTIQNFVNSDAQKQVEILQKEIVNQEKLIVEQEKIVKELKGHYEEVQNDLLVSRKREKQNEHKILELDSDGLILEQSLKEKEKQIEELQKKLEEFAEKEAQEPVSNDSMYLQLKNQFKEKSDILHETRRELFHTQEQLLALQKEIEEKQYENPSEEVLVLQKSLNRLAKEYERAEKLAQAEIEGLYDLVAAVLRQKSS